MLKNDERKNIYKLETKEANDLKIMLSSVEMIFMQLRKKSEYQVEKEWKDLFSEKIVLTLDTFLKEISEETGINYFTDMRIEDLREYIENINNS